MIRLAELNDKEAISKIFYQYKENMNKLYEFDKIVGSNVYELYVYEKDGALSGFILLEKTFEIKSILHLFVVEEKRKKHIASELIDYVLSNCENIDSFILEVSVDNKVAIKLYEKFGFEIIGKRKEYYDGIDALVMEKKVNYE